MPVDGPVPWDRVEHTAAKHDIYRRYLHRWFPIILSNDAWQSATYAEGFAGPGVYSQGEDGSPIIAIRAFAEEVGNTARTARFVFIDDDPRCVKMLGEQLKRAFPQRPRPRETMPVTITQGACADTLEPQLDKVDAWGSPILAVLDSWGNAPATYRFMQRLAQNTASEVIITFSPQHFVRFVSDLGEHADDVFGGDRTWREAGTIDSDQKRQFILSCYRNALKAAGFRFLLDFELVDRRGNALYLVFATNHPLGVQKMKDSLWEVDRTFGVEFRDPRDEQLETLFDFEHPHLAPLTRLLDRKMEELKETRVEILRQYTLLNTVFRPEHVATALQPLLKSEKLVRVDKGGNLRRASIIRVAPN